MRRLQGRGAMGWLAEDLQTDAFWKNAESKFFHFGSIISEG